MKGKGAHNVFQQVNLRVKDFTQIDDIDEHLDSQIDKALMKSREKIWRKYETLEIWMAFDVEKKRYDSLVTFTLLWVISVAFPISPVTTTGDHSCLIGRL